MDAEGKIGMCSGVGGPVGGVPLIGDGGGSGEMGGGLVIAAEEEGEFSERVGNRTQG